MSITFSGLSTGLDTNSIIDSLMEVERQPINRLENQKKEEVERLNAYKQFDERLEALKKAASAMSLTSQVKTAKITLPDNAPFTATSTGATTGEYDISVQQLASVQKTVTNGWSSRTDPVLGTGTLTINGVDLEITDENNSLASLVSTINERSEQLGVTATIMNDGDATNPYRLVLTGNNTSSSFTVDATQLTGSETPFTATNTSEAKRAQVYVDGILVESDNNTITEAIEGVTLNLNSVSSIQSEGPPPVYQTSHTSLSQDTDAIKEKITSFVTAYNDVINWIMSGYEEFGGSATATTVDEDGKETTKELLGGILRGDATVNSVKRGLQNILGEAIQGTEKIQTMSQLGIKTNLNGTLTLDSDEMSKAVDANPGDMVAFLSGTDSTNGVMKKFNLYLGEKTAGAGNIYEIKKTKYQSAVDRIDTQIARLEPRLQKRETMLRAQFTAMENLVSSLNSQANFLAQQLGQKSGDK